MDRTAGILLHPTSLPGRGPCGDLGAGATRFLDWLQSAGITLWQVLPLGPVGYGDSPYTPTSVFAGNPLLVSVESLLAEGWIAEAEPAAASPGDGSARCDLAAARALKDAVFRRAWESLPAAPKDLRQAHTEFVEERRGGWLDDWALYSALKERFELREWSAWPDDLARRHPAALALARRELASEIGRHRFVQFLFERQWSAVRDAAAERGIRILGDLPIYTALDSADVWSHPELFDLDDNGAPRAVAGVPPDYFSATGQLWGNPLYRWDRHDASGFAWWNDRLRVQLERADLLRIDHFRGLEAYWEVPADEPTAAGGRWRPAPGARLLRAAADALGALPLVAEDLGVITPAVEALRDDFGLPGMKVLQFAFDEPASNHLPHYYRRRSIAYTGTHDNDTARGWFAAAPAATRRRALTYLGGDAAQIHLALLRAAWTSVAECAVAPLQDVLGLGAEARLNHPGLGSGNWTWRVRAPELTPGAAQALRELTIAAGRAAQPTAPPADRPGGPTPQ
jgi:4-alpha-glucanotransferase